jgi:TctA family transporter
MDGACEAGDSSVSTYHSQIFIPVSVVEFPDHFCLFYFFLDKLTKGQISIVYHLASVVVNFITFSYVFVKLLYQMEPILTGMILGEKEIKICPVKLVIMGEGLVLRYLLCSIIEIFRFRFAQMSLRA